MIATGYWHLVDEGADEGHIPDHRMDLVIRGDGERLSGAILSRIDGTEIPLADTMSFDGDVLRIQMKAPPDRTQGDMPVLLMRAVGDRFHGHWTKDDVPVGPGLKLVRHDTCAQSHD